MKTWKRILLAAAYVLSAPFLAVALWRRGLRALVVLRLAVTTEIRCYHCGAGVSLVGMWECGGCGFIARGHLLAPCKICGRVPRVARCTRCRVTTKLI